MLRYCKIRGHGEGSLVQTTPQGELVQDELLSVTEQTLTLEVGTYSACCYTTWALEDF